MNSLLESVPIFAGLDEKALELLLGQVKQQDYPESAIVVREGETSNRFFLIGSGSVRVCKNFGQTDQIELATLGPKNFFGEMCILETLPRSATVQAVATSTLFIISSLAFHKLYQDLPAQHSILLLNIARDLSRRIRRLDELFAARH
jgi:CRP/FNR family transcriptional regulator, cyclic AMP receptor protein